MIVTMKWSEYITTNYILKPGNKLATGYEKK